jgi:hypothetical protein
MTHYHLIATQVQPINPSFQENKYFALGQIEEYTWFITTIYFRLTSNDNHKQIQKCKIVLRIK